MRTRHNKFIQLNEIGEGEAFTENGAVSYASTGSELVNQFSKAGTYRGREYAEVWQDQAKLWNEDKTAAVRFPFYLRMITRKDNVPGTCPTRKVQRGQGQRDEAFKRLLWLAVYHTEVFYKNLWLLPVVGCWKDLLTLLYMAETDTFPVDRVSVDRDKVYDLFIAGLAGKDQKDLVKKYLPRIRSAKQCTTSRARFCNRFAKGFMRKLGLDPKGYRAIKTSGIAHRFQQAISRGLYADIEWGKIPGKALLQLIDGNFLDAHGLTDNYMEWLQKQPVVNFNGYPYELMNTLCRHQGKTHRLATEYTVNKQFDNLIRTANAEGGAISGNVLCCLDTSGSMMMPLANGTTTAIKVCLALGIYFSELNTGAFHNTVCMFDDTSRLLSINGTFSEKVRAILKDRVAWGSTNFQSVIDLLCRTRIQHPEIPLADFPKTLLVVSDMQFNPTGNVWYQFFEPEITNNDEMMARLREVFPSDFVDDMKFIWWDVAGRGEDYPTNIDKGGQYVFSGFDGAVISLLLGGEPETTQKRLSMEEMVNQALEQEVLQLVAIAD